MKTFCHTWNFPSRPARRSVEFTHTSGKHFNLPTFQQFIKVIFRRHLAELGTNMPLWALTRTVRDLWRCFCTFATCLINVCVGSTPVTPALTEPNATPAAVIGHSRWYAVPFSEYRQNRQRCQPGLGSLVLFHCYLWSPNSGFTFLCSCRELFFSAERAGQRSSMKATAAEIKVFLKY